MTNKQCLQILGTLYEKIDDPISEARNANMRFLQNYRKQTEYALQVFHCIKCLFAIAQTEDDALYEHYLWHFNSMMTFMGHNVEDIAVTVYQKCVDDDEAMLPTLRELFDGN